MQIGLRKSPWFKKVKQNSVPRTYFISKVDGEEIVGTLDE